MLAFFEQSRLFLPILLQGVYYTIVVTIGAFVLSTILGLLWAFMRVSGLAR